MSTFLVKAENDSTVQQHRISTKAGWATHKAPIFLEILLTHACAAMYTIEAAFNCNTEFTLCV